MTTSHVSPWVCGQGTTIYGEEQDAVSYSWADGEATGGTFPVRRPSKTGVAGNCTQITNGIFGPDTSTCNVTYSEYQPAMGASFNWFQKDYAWSSEHHVYSHPAHTLL